MIRTSTQLRALCLVVLAMILPGCATLNSPGATAALATTSDVLFLKSQLTQVQGIIKDKALSPTERLVVDTALENVSDIIADLDEKSAAEIAMDMLTYEQTLDRIGASYEMGRSGIAAFHKRTDTEPEPLLVVFDASAVRTYRSLLEAAEKAPPVEKNRITQIRGALYIVLQGLAVAGGANPAVIAGIGSMAGSSTDATP